MIIAVMSNSHDNRWNLRKALAIIKEKNAGMIIGGFYKTMQSNNFK